MDSLFFKELRTLGVCPVFKLAQMLIVYTFLIVCVFAVPVHQLVSDLQHMFQPVKRKLNSEFVRNFPTSKNHIE